MKKIYLVALLAFGFLSNANSQDAKTHRTCASHDVHERMISSDPNYAVNQALIENQTAAYIQSGQASRAVVTIPVVVHIVYNTSAQNISDAQILSQMDVLNEDFAKTNADASLIPSVFAGLAANTQIQFCLAKRDPSGNATTGIVRRSTTVTSFSSNNAVKYTANGGSNAWDATKYLNIWVCNLSGGLLGYAQFPGGAAATDGVVCLYTAFGRVGNVVSPFHKGRTATHEVGHWLNLRHIWGDANCGNDLVNDTPTQQTSNTGCPAFPKVTCGNGPNGDMHMNYMDYTNDACMYMFTAGQSARMNAVLVSGGARYSLLSSLGCTPPSATCGVPTSLSASSITSSSATLNWGAVSGAVSYNVQYRVNGGSTWTTTTSTTNSRAISGLAASTTYQYQIQTVCSGSSSAYSAIASFTTSASVCADPYEPNETSTAAKAFTLGVPNTARISSTTDKDWYVFSNTSTQKNIQVTLTNLPADYDVKLYNSALTQIGISQAGGTTSELIKYNNGAVGTYYIQVYGYSGANSTACYTMTTTISSTAFRGSEDINVAEEFKIVPNPAVNEASVWYTSKYNGTAKIRITDMLGRTVKMWDASISEGSNIISAEISGLNEGIYLVQLQAGDDIQISRMMIRK
jgi:hypothetical protein